MNEIIEEIDEKHPEITQQNNEDDVLFILKMMAFQNKFKSLHWSAPNLSYHKTIDDFNDQLYAYIDDMAENIQSIIGQFNGGEFTTIQLPISNNPLDIINELKVCLNNWMAGHGDDMEYEGCRNITSGFLEIVHKYIYLFRLCKIS